MNVFISYRRDDSGPTARLMRHVLSERFGASSVFMDLDQIPYGADFEAAIREHLGRADVVLVIVGSQWARILEERLADPETDWVRREVAIALERGAQGHLRVVPVLVDGTKLRGGDLPADVAPLATLNGPLFDTRASNEGEARVLAAVEGESAEQRLARERAQRHARRTALVIGMVVFLAAWSQLLNFVGLDDYVNLWTLRLAHLAGPPSLPPPAGKIEIALVALDDDTDAEMPSPAQRRAALARVVAHAAAAGARSLALDLEFDEPLGDESADAALAAALAAAPPLPVVLGVSRDVGDRKRDDPAPVLPHFAEPTNMGVACVGERGGVVATLPLVVLRRGSYDMPSLGLAAYVAAQGQKVGNVDLGTLRLTLERDGAPATEVQAFAAEELDDPDVCTVLRPGDVLVQQWLDEQAPPVGGIGTRVSLKDVARGDPAALAALKERIVIVGDFRRRIVVDRHTTATGKAQGASLIAAQVDGLLRGSAIRPLTALEQGLLLVGATVGGAALASTLRGPRTRWLGPALAAAAVLCLASTVAGYRGFRVLAGPHYAVIALFLGAWVARRFRRG